MLATPATYFDTSKKERVKSMEGIEHKQVSINGLEMHIAEKGQGPVVLFLHGFPELWYSWRHQIAYVAAHGYRAVAPDLRGYGDTSGAPKDDFSKFTLFHLVGDIVALIDYLVPDKEEKVFVVGHDWGAYLAWFLCLFRSDRVKALVNLSVHFIPHSPISLTDGLRAAYGDDHYFYRFQGKNHLKIALRFCTATIFAGAWRVEAEFSQIGTRTVVEKFLTYRDPAPFRFPKGKGFGNSPNNPVELPDWLSKEDVDYYTAKFEKNGFTGGINYYRAIDLNWELTSAWTGAKVNVPTKFIVGDLDLVYNIPGAKEYMHNGEFKKDVPRLDEVIVLEGVAHFINQEKPDEINKHIHDFLEKF